MFSLSTLHREPRQMVRGYMSILSLLCQDLHCTFRTGTAWGGERGFLFELVYQKGVTFSDLHTSVPWAGLGG